jgi:hypothetical protein
MGVLAAALARGVALERARPLLEASVRSLLTLRLDAEETLFPCNAGEQTGALAWCAGDPGVAGVLHGVGRALDAPAVAEVAVEGGRRIARAIANHEDHDPSLCHGWSGIGHVLNRLGQASGEAGLRDGARLAFERLLALPDSHNRSLLTGDAGAGLALLAAVRPTEPSWDRLLLLSHG